MSFLTIRDLNVNIEDKKILNGVNLDVDKGEVHAIMGLNGSGKSTLANVLLGHPRYSITSGDILVNNESIINLRTDERARKGLFLGFQYPTEVSGVGYSHFLRNAYNLLSKSLTAEQKDREVFITVKEFHEYLKKNLDNVGLDQSFLSRYLNEGFSGGEKKRSEVMQMLVLRPNLAILDEPINKLIETGAGVIVITHYARILRYLNKLDKVHVMSKGKIVKTAGKELSEELESKGYAWLGLSDESVDVV